jgi:hypothetical protein
MKDKARFRYHANGTCDFMHWNQIMPIGLNGMSPELTKTFLDSYHADRDVEPIKTQGHVNKKFGSWLWRST